MGSKYKKEFEREWDNKPLSEMKLKTIKLQTDKNLSDVINGKFSRRRLK